MIREYISQFGFIIDQLVYNFVSQEELLEMNQKYLNHTTHTDIISFNYSSKESLRAEFFISLWAVERSAEEESQSVENECLRVIVHGILHCLGFNDASLQEKAKMRTLENNFIDMFHVKQKAHV
ncbi:rRNA maturation RNase YbeY [Flavobacteriaceae bacterium]|nr:rRNA maturation RNase YbeY [Flavobacteriaceae bacterium]MDA9263134.1 rRNA maturation RNase YbeY [bacterium]MBT4313224.1 rRNA maturation RNase YbeY [Flavobacteriaceae bacterium]MBT5091942.1 rRNA maturation RNase YbeY [Flavobacteriaceae bacterium]MBT5282558.1 rRNA maturation RNase YbeY [Flavobacteriaceae bacterium]